MTAVAADFRRARRGWLGELLAAASVPDEESASLVARRPDPGTLALRAVQAELDTPTSALEPESPPAAPPPAKPEADRAALDQYLSDLRDAHHLNTLWTAMSHAGQDTWTPEIVARWRRMRAETESIASGSGEGAHPTGHGPLARTRLAQRLAAMVSAQAAAATAQSATTPVGTPVEAPAPIPTQHPQQAPQPDSPPSDSLRPSDEYGSGSAI